MRAARCVLPPGTVGRAVSALRPFAFVAVAILTAACDRARREPPSQSSASATAAQPGHAPTPLFTCRNGGGPELRASSTPSVPATDASIAATRAADLAAARSARESWADQSFDAYLQSLRRECGPGGKFLVDGDVAIGDVKLLREFFETHIQATRIQGPAQPQPGEQSDAGRATSRSRLSPARRGGQELLWTTHRKRALSYCVSTAFGGQHDKVVADMEAATGAWEQVADVDFRHASAQDASCTAQNESVVFDVNPVDVDGDYLARAFFPGEPRADRNVYIDLTALSFDPGQELQLTGVLRHQLGHVLGFGHEHPRPASGACFEDDGFQPIAAYDALSVMHYPQCNGGTSWKLLLTESDRAGAACVYGAATGFPIDPALCTPPRAHTAATAGAPIMKSFPNQSVSRSAMREYGPFVAQPGSLVRASLQPRGARRGDPDLYVRLGRLPVVRPPAFTCCPFLTGARESCELDAGASPNNLVRVVVHGYTAGSYDLDVSFVPLTP